MGTISKLSAEFLQMNDYINQLKSLAQKILNKELGLNEGTIEVVYILNKLPRAVCYDPSLLVFHALSSETTHLPLTRVRHLWAPESLAKADKELDEIESHYRERINKACMALLCYDFDKLGE